MLPKISFVRLPHAVGLRLPAYTDGIGTTLPLYAACAASVKIGIGESALIPTGLIFALPLGAELQIRSSRAVSEETGLIVLNAPATYDASSRDELKVLVQNTTDRTLMIRRGQEIASLVFAPVLRVTLDEVPVPTNTKKSS